MGGTNSPFRINLDGVSDITMKDIELESNDSLFMFVEVTLDVNSQNTPHGYRRFDSFKNQWLTNM